MSIDPNEQTVEEIPDLTLGGEGDGEPVGPLGRRWPIIGSEPAGSGPQAWRLGAAIRKHPFGFTLLVVGAGVLIGWSIIAPIYWQEIIKSQSRLGYLVGDGFLVAPGCLLAGWGLLREHSWAPASLLIVIGAAAFDLTHTFIYMAEVKFPKIGGSPPPIWAYALCVVIIWGALNWLAWRVIRLQIKGNSDLEPWSWLRGFIPSVILVIILVSLGYALR